MIKHCLRLTITLVFFSTLLGCSTDLTELKSLGFGSDSTFDVVSWNVGLFPKNRSSANVVETILASLEADVYALQEIEDTTLLKKVVANIPDYKCHFQRNNYGGLAYVYNTTTVKVNEKYEILSSEPYYEDIRRYTFASIPQVLNLSFYGENYFVINNHFICCGDGILKTNEWWDEENRKLKAATQLKEYIDNNLASKNVIVVGDLNDQLIDSPSNNVFQNLINDSVNYLFADMKISLGNSADWSWPKGPAQLDHILITNELFADFQHPNSEVTVIRIDDYMSGWWNYYKRKVSDHRPVGIRLDF